MKWNHHKPLLLELEPIRGFYVPEMPPPYSYKKIEFKVPNKAYRNFVYWINSFLTNSEQGVTDYAGTGHGINQFRHSWYYSATAYPTIPEYGRFEMAYGSSTNPHDITRYDLYSRHGALSWMDGFSWVVWESSSTKIMTYTRYCFGAPSLSCGEAGLYFLTHLGERNVTRHMIARAIIDPPVTKEYNTIYEEGWVVEFPSEYTRMLPSMLSLCSYHSHPPKFMFQDATGTLRRIRTNQPSAGSPDVMIGSDNTPTSPDDYSLKSPIASLSNQSHAVEVDTTLQELRIIRQGTYTPSTNVTLGEVALFINVYDDTGTARKMMIARGVFDPPITLMAGSTYTIGIVLKM